MKFETVSPVFVNGYDSGIWKYLSSAIQSLILLATISFGSDQVLGQQLCTWTIVEYYWGFGNNGIAIDNNNGNPMRYNASAVQPDGKLVVAGATFQNGDWDFAIVRYNPDGTLDTAFSGDGIVTVDFGGTVDLANAVAIQPDGKIVVAGNSSVLGDSSTSNFAIARLDPNGTLDRTFGRTVGFATRTGKQITDFFGQIDNATAVALQADGKIVVGGSANDGSGLNLAVARYNANGTLDGSFSGDGKADFDVTLTNGIADLAIQPDGKIVSVGESDFDILALRLNTNGSPDAGFGILGKVTVDFSGGRDGASSLVLQPDGKMVIGGSSWANSNASFNNSALIRLNSNGTLDKSFNGNGKFTVSLSNFNDRITDVVLYNNEIFASVSTDEPGKFTMLDFRPGSTCYRVTNRFLGGSTFSSSISILGSRIYSAGYQFAPDNGWVLAFDTSLDL